MRIRNSRKMLIKLALLALVALGSACKSDTPCSQDETFDKGYCYPNPKDAQAAVTTGVDASPTVAIDGGGGMFGQACTSSADCLPPTTMCAPVLSYCTAMSCDVDLTLCPVGWTCMDLATYGATGHMCMKL